MSFRDQVVRITGASSGVGEGLAEAFAEAGARMVIAARRREELERVDTATGPGLVQITLAGTTRQGYRRYAPMEFEIRGRASDLQGESREIVRCARNCRLAA